jgi:gas vesicle protein
MRGSMRTKHWRIMVASALAMLTLAAVSTLLVSRVAGDEDTGGDETLPPYLGKSLSAQIQDLVQQHKEKLLEIRLEMKMALLQTWVDRLNELDEEQTRVMETVETMEQEMTMLEERLRNGEITQGEYIMEMNRLRLEIRTRLRQLEGVEKEALKALQENIPESNKELAKRIVDANHAFRDAKKALQEEKKAEIKARVEEQKQAKGKNKG